MNFKEKLEKLTQANRVSMQQLENNKQIWVQELNNLYLQINKWFNEYIENGYIIIDNYSLQSAECEEFLMETQIMELNLGGGPTVILEPTGINIVGAFGKIDLYLRGYKDKKVFLLLIENEENKEARHWEIWKNRKQKERMMFNKEAFEKILNEWIEKWTSAGKKD